MAIQSDTGSEVEPEPTAAGRGRPRAGRRTPVWLAALTTAAVVVAAGLLIGVLSMAERRPLADAVRQTAVFVSPGPDQIAPVAEVATSTEDLQGLWTRWQIPGAPPPVQAPNHVSVTVWGGRQAGAVQIREFRWDGPTIVVLGTVPPANCPRIAAIGATVEVWSVRLPESGVEKITAAVETETRDAC
jgi:hypothetical protein